MTSPILAIITRRMCHTTTALGLEAKAVVDGVIIPGEDARAVKTEGIRCVMVFSWGANQMNANARHRFRSIQSRSCCFRSITFSTVAANGGNLMHDDWMLTTFVSISEPFKPRQVTK